DLKNISSERIRNVEISRSVECDRVQAACRRAAADCISCSGRAVRAKRRRKLEHAAAAEIRYVEIARAVEGKSQRHCSRQRNRGGQSAVRGEDVNDVRDAELKSGDVNVALRICGETFRVARNARS